MFEIPECLQKLGVHFMSEEEKADYKKIDPEFASEEELESGD